MIEIEVEIDAELPAAEVQGIEEQIDRLEEVAEMQVRIYPSQRGGCLHDVSCCVVDTGVTRVPQTAQCSWQPRMHNGRCPSLRMLKLDRCHAG